MRPNAPNFNANNNMNQYDPMQNRIANQVNNPTNVPQQLQSFPLQQQSQSISLQQQQSRFIQPVYQTIGTPQQYQIINTVPQYNNNTVQYGAYIPTQQAPFIMQPTPTTSTIPNMPVTTAYDSGYGSVAGPRPPASTTQYQSPGNVTLS